jgi:hypothetical protein
MLMSAVKDAMQILALGEPQYVVLTRGKKCELRGSHHGQNRRL